MVLLPESVYAAWRTSALTGSFLRETPDGTPTEHLLQLVWQHQRFRSEALRAVDGRRVRVLHPGFWNRGAGPDFRDAVIRFENDPARRGDVEIDLQAAGWVNHRHHVNPDYEKVLLQVVWEPPAKVTATRAMLVLRNLLDDSVEELIAWADLEPGLPDHVLGRCAARLRHAGETATISLLEQAGRFRFERKGKAFAHRARAVGWEQSLWEGLCGGLGYEHNVWPMRRLAEQRSLFLAEAERGTDTAGLQALLLGVSGLLPHEARHRDAQAYLRRLWQVWWRERERFESIQLPQLLWRLGRTRPSNHPQRRVALAAHWLAEQDLPKRLERWLAAPMTEARFLPELLRELQVEQDAFWSCHWSLQSAAMATPAPLLGTARAGDLAVNVILPWLWVRARTGRNTAWRQEAERRYLAWPALQDNARLRLARERLFGGDGAAVPWNAARQQGLLQVIRDFCGHSNALCDNCTLPARLAAAGADYE